MSEGGEGESFSTNPINLHECTVNNWDASRQPKERIHQLTGLPAETPELRAALRERVKEVVGGGRSVTVGLLDMDGLAGINARHGHDIGNMSIQVWGEWLKDQLTDFTHHHPETEVYLLQVFGHRGDEFKVVIIGTEEERLLQEINNKQLVVNINGESIEISGSCGFTFAEENGERSDDLTNLEQRANRLLFEQKIEKMAQKLESLNKPEISPDDFKKVAGELIGWRKLPPEQVALLLEYFQQCVIRQQIKPGNLFGKN